ncbi:MAG: glucose 1-dehydrogenase [Oscillospiraceae bacterium]|nr:glucose 1-dehydrogenase [Oscillospiraceae bacterium]
MKLQNKSVVVTGASSGMGKAIVELFAREGANIVAVARRAERLEELAASLASAPGKVVPFAGDVSREETMVGAIDLAVKEFGRLDILINNAGVMDDMSPIGDIKNEKIDQVFSVNVYGPMYSMRKAVQVFLAQGGGGNIINVASLGAMRSCAGAIYTASKAAVVSLTKNTAYMYMPDGIRCNAIAPGGIATEISTSMGMPNMAGYGRVKNVLATAPAPGSPEQIASAALFLASDDSSYVNGDVLLVDGGWAAG